MRDYGLKMEEDAEEFVRNELRCSEGTPAALEQNRICSELEKNWSWFAWMLGCIAERAAGYYALEQKAEFDNTLLFHARHSILTLPPDVKWSPLVFSQHLLFAIIRKDNPSAVQIAKRIEEERSHFSDEQPYGLISQATAALFLGRSDLAQNYAAALADKCTKKAYRRLDCETSAPLSEAIQAIIEGDAQRLHAAGEIRPAIFRRWIDKQLKNRYTETSPCDAKSTDFWDMEMTILLLIAHKTGMPVPASPFFDISWWV